MNAGLAEIQAILCRAGLASLGSVRDAVPLEGGVSSDIVRVDLVHGSVCVKRALSKLKVTADWRAPVSRNLFEAIWFKIAGAIVPQAVPKIFHIDASAHAIVMEFLGPDQHRVWKQLLRDGEIRPQTARAVAEVIAAIHDATSRQPRLPALFPTDRTFHAIRIEPYLLATAERHHDMRLPLREIARQTASTKFALVHGDVSPKNILVGPEGPVILDAECAWFGDPAFDIAFCLNHLLLKCVWRPSFSEGYLACFNLMAETYLGRVTWEPPEALEKRAAWLLAALFLARIDGKSPVEYIEREDERDRVRGVARALIRDRVERFDDVRTAWSLELGLNERNNDH